MSQYVKPITLEKIRYSHPSSGRQGVVYALHVDGKPLHMDTWMTPDAGKYALLFAAAPDLLDALEEIVNNAVVNYEGSMDIYSEAVNAARAAIRKAKGGGDE